MLEDVLSVQDTASMASLLEILVILWKSVQKSLMANQEAFKYTTSKFASVLPQYLKIFQVRVTFTHREPKGNSKSKAAHCNHIIRADAIWLQHEVVVCICVCAGGAV